MTPAPAGRPGAAAGAAGRQSAPALGTASAAAIPVGLLIERGRAKAHRPLPRDVRVAAVERGVAAYDHGAWYLAHEELEPAWMGTDDLGERALLSGVIKLAAAHVHAARGNPLGVRTNLRGARERLADAAAATTGSIGAMSTIDLPALLAGIDDRLAQVEDLCAVPPPAALGGDGVAAPPHDVAGPPSRFRGAPVAIAPLPLPRRSA